jgi:uncharacterized membrane protein
MSTFSSIPGWDGIHPAMVQYAIVLLSVAPLLVLVSLFSRNAWRTWAGAALLLMGLGVLAAWLAVASGHAAGQLVDKTPDLSRAIARHEALGMRMRNVFTLFALLFGALLLLPAILRRAIAAPARIAIYALFLVVYLGATLLIADTAERGGQLTHALGVRAIVPVSNEPVATRAAAPAIATSPTTPTPVAPGRPAPP